MDKVLASYLTMVKSCCAVGCHNKYEKGKGIQFYRFPTDPERKSKWVSAVSRKDWEPTEYSWICSEHFVSGTKSNNPLAPNYVPTIFKHIGSPSKRRVQSRMVSFNRRQSMKRRRRDNEASSSASISEEVETVDDIDSNSPMVYEEDGNVAITEEQLVSNAHDKLETMKYKALQKELDQVQKEKDDLRRAYDELKTNVCFMEENFKDDNKKVKYYTGLPSYSVLKALFDYMSEDLQLPSTITSAKKSVFEQLIMVLMKLHLNLGDQDLAYRFQVTQSTVSRYFNRWIDVLYTCFSCLITWPERDELMKTMPMEFRKHFRKCVVIIDCFEIFIERPTSQTPRAQTWSNYKHHNTVKFLIGITPQGSVAFISQGWGGRTSDVYLTENCGILQKLLPGDLVLADRGFTIEVAAGLYCAEVQVPPFTRGKKQLSRIEVDAARRLSRVRIHVERVIGSIRQKFTILQSTIPINMLMCEETEKISNIDKIVTVCCALCNCNDSIVQTD